MTYVVARLFFVCPTVIINDINDFFKMNQSDIKKYDTQGAEIKNETWSYDIYEGYNIDIGNVILESAKKLYTKSEEITKISCGAKDSYIGITITGDMRSSFINISKFTMDLIADLGLDIDIDFFD